MGLSTPKHAMRAARSPTKYLSDSATSGLKHSFGIDARNSRSEGTGPSGGASTDDASPGGIATPIAESETDAPFLP